MEGTNMSERSNILLAGWYFFPKTGGAETVMLLMAQYLANKGYTVTVLTSTEEEDCDDELDGIKILRRKFYSPKSDYDLDSLAQQFNQILDQYQPAIIHFHNGSYPAGTTDRSIGVRKIKKIFQIIKERQIKVIEHAHNAQLADTEITKELRDLAWDRLICVSNFTKEHWRELGTGAKEIEVVHNCIDLNLFRTAEPKEEIEQIKNNRKVIFFPARIFRLSNGELSSQKNFRMVLEAVKLLAKEVNNFLVVAIANDETESAKETYASLKNEIAESGLSDNVHFVASVLPTEMPQYYSASDIVCVPSINETFGLVYLEAMASGKIAIATNTGGPKEYINSGQTGYLVEPGNFEELKNILLPLLQDDQLTESIKQNAQKAADNFSVDKFGQQIEEIYAELLS